jgi:phenylacetate-CoA ligase
VVVSNLINRGTVLLNYRLGDLAMLLPDPCPCGRSLPLLSQPQGRSDEWLTLPSGRRAHPQTAISVVRFAPGLWQFQITQVTPGLLHLSVVVDDTLDRAQFVARVREELPAALGEPLEVQVQFVDSIPRTPGGKVRTVNSWVGK